MSTPLFAPPETAVPGCPLCEACGGLLVWQDAAWRLIRADEADFPAFYRVVLRRHAAEFSELGNAERARCMALVVAVEQVLRDLLRPTKVNLAALGNAVPHLHWHVIARFYWDSHFPQPVWGVRQREAVPSARVRLAVTPEALDIAMAAALSAL